MKKILITFALIVLFLVGNVNAKEELLKFDWAIKQGGAANYLYYDHTIEDGDYYVTASINKNNIGVIRKISNDGKKIIWEDENDWGLYLALEQDDNYYYALFVATDSDYYNDSYYDVYGNYYLTRFDKSSGKLLDYLYLTDDDSLYDGEIYTKSGKIYVLMRGENLDSQKMFTIISSEKKFNVLEENNYNDLSSSEINQITDGLYTFLSDELYDVFSLPSTIRVENCKIDESTYFCESKSNVDNISHALRLFYSNAFYINNYVYLVGEYSYLSENGSRKINSDNYSFIMKVNTENKKVEWLKKAEEGITYFDVTGNGNYVTVVGYQDDKNSYIGEERDSESVKSYIYVYDTNGNLVETHDLATDAKVSRVDITHILKFGSSLVGQAFAYDKNGNISSIVFRYNDIKKVETKVNGNGKIEFIGDCVAGKEIEYSVTPEEGWKLDSVVVKDAKGNIIETKNNKFIMPESDVTIEAKFVINIVNPDTSDFNVFFIVGIISIFGILLLITSKKLHFLK